MATGIGDEDSVNALEEFAHAGVIHEPEVVSARAKRTQVHVYYLLAELVGDPGYYLNVESCEWRGVEGTVDFHVSAAFDCQFPHLVAGEKVERVEAEPDIADRVDHLYFVAVLVAQRVNAAVNAVLQLDLVLSQR